MASSFYFIQAEKTEKKAELLNQLEIFADINKKQIYVVDKPLGGNKYEYEFEDGLVILSPNNKLIFVNYSDTPDEFEDFVEDFIEDLGFIADKYDYKKVIGRPRNWRQDLVATEDYRNGTFDVEELFRTHSLTTNILKKKCELLISLLTGSVNDINLIKGDIPNNILDKIKQKIILFDGDQTRFIYQENVGSKVTIQGLSGTGKTELLLHKLKEIYMADNESKIMFTCHNKILADSLRNRIPDFFNFMKVEEQIKWNKRLWCVNAWGSQYIQDSGAYSYICSFYGLDFRRYSHNTTFSVVCSRALEELKKNNGVEEKGHAFDYFLIDESQDFPNSFFELCEAVTKKTIYVAGDIFQSIFVEQNIDEVEPDFLLSKCYRTDPKTLMFAHAVGMGLFESPKLRWLEDREWKACGYQIEKSEEGQKYLLSREPLRRFEDLQENAINSIEIISTDSKDRNSIANNILEILQKIIEDNPTVMPDDIGVIFIENTKESYLTVDYLEYLIQSELGWQVNKAYETKERILDTLFVSNKNHVKGLEFPFVICVTSKIQQSKSYRNALYMMMTRSFITTYLLVSHEDNKELIPVLKSGLDGILKEGMIIVQKPSEDEISSIRTKITCQNDTQTLYDLVYHIFDEIDVDEASREKLFGIVKIHASQGYDYDSVYEIIDFNYSKMLKKF